MEFDNVAFSLTIPGASLPFYNGIWRRPVMTESEYNAFKALYDTKKPVGETYPVIASSLVTDNPNLNEFGEWLWDALALKNVIGWRATYNADSDVVKWYERYLPGFTGDMYLTFKDNVPADEGSQTAGYIASDIVFTSGEVSETIRMSYIDPNNLNNGYNVGPTVHTSRAGLLGNVVYIPLGYNEHNNTFHTAIVIKDDDTGETKGYAPIIVSSSYEGLTYTMRGFVGTIETESQMSGSDVDIYAFMFANEYPIGDTDPFSFGGASGAGGGTGTFSGTGDMISIPSLPTLSAVSAGFIKLFVPTASQMASLASYMWSGAFDLDTFKKIFADPMDCILGLSIVPVAVSLGGASVVKVGNISTDVSMNTATSQYVAVDCGTLNVQEYWGAYLDYEPFTKAEIYLPYVGTHPISIDDIMGKSVHVVYHVDILSGACCAYVQCGGTVLYSFIGQCSASIPITGNDWTNVVNGVLSIAGSVGSMVASGGATAPSASLSVANTAINSLKPSIEKSGSLSGVGGILGVQTPYLILTRPKQALPAKQNTFMGYPSFITRKLSSVSGYTEVETVHLENMSCTDSEISEITSLLKSGVIL